MHEESWPWEEEDPQEYGLHHIEQMKALRDGISELLREQMDSTPKAAWPDEEAPVLGEHPGLSASFLNRRTMAFRKLKEALDLVEDALSHL